MGLKWVDSGNQTWLAGKSLNEHLYMGIFQRDMLEYLVGNPTGL